MARVEKVPVEFEYSLAGLTADDLTVLDLALAHLTDVVRKNPKALSTNSQQEALQSLYQQVIDIKRGD
jgi:hypothetical protein